MNISSTQTQPSVSICPSHLEKLVASTALRSLQDLGNGVGPRQSPPSLGRGAGSIGEYQHAVHGSAQAHALSVLQTVSRDGAHKLGTALQRLQGVGAPFGTRVMNQLTVMGAVHHALQRREAALAAVPSGSAVQPREHDAVVQARVGLEQAMSAVARRAAACSDGAADGYLHGCGESDRLVKAINAANQALADCHRAAGSQVLVENLVHGIIAPHLQRAVAARWPALDHQADPQLKLEDVLHRDLIHTAGWASQNLMGSGDADEFKAGVLHLLKLPEYVLDGKSRAPRGDTPAGQHGGPGPDPAVPAVPAGRAAPAGAPVAYARSGDVKGGDNYSIMDLSALKGMMEPRQSATPDLRALLNDVYNHAHADGMEIGRLKAENLHLAQQLAAREARSAVQPDAPPAPVDEQPRELPPVRAQRLDETVTFTERRHGPPVPPKPQRLGARIDPDPRHGGVQEEWRAYVGELNQANRHVQRNADNGLALQADADDRPAIHRQGHAAGAGVPGTEVVLMQALPHDVKAFARVQPSAGRPADIGARLGATPLAGGEAGTRVDAPPADGEWKMISQHLQAREQRTGDLNNARNLTLDQVRDARQAAAPGQVPEGGGAPTRSAADPQSRVWARWASHPQAQREGHVPNVDADADARQARSTVEQLLQQRLASSLNAAASGGAVEKAPPAKRDPSVSSIPPPPPPPLPVAP